MDDDAPRVLRRIRLMSVGAYFLFAIYVGFSMGARGLIGLTCCAAVTMISFLWLEEILTELLRPASHLHARRLMWRTLARFILLGAAVSVAIFVAHFDALSVLLGFSVVVVGIMGEAVYATVRSFSR
jgi:hypothetical protein